MRITWAEINLSAIRHNLICIRHAAPNSTIIAVVKANAYGHGIVHVAQEAVDAGADYLGVGFLEEGILLRKKSISCPILVLGGVLFHQVRRFLENDLDITVSSLGLAYAVNSAARQSGTRARIHLKFDTGLNRIGINHEKASLVFERLKPLDHIDIVGVYSHFSTADAPNSDFTHLQLERFKHIISVADSFGIQPRYRHIACSGALLQHSDACFNMIRAGLIMYGLYPTPSIAHPFDLQPVLSFKSRVVFLKDVPEGQPISYGRTYYTQRRTRIATIPVGYGDGYNRALSNRGEVLIGGRRFPVVGRICMDQIMVDIGQDSSIRVGDEVVIYGEQGDERISVEEIAEKLGTIPYEVVCWIAHRVPRVFVRNG